YPRLARRRVAHRRPNDHHITANVGRTGPSIRLRTDPKVDAAATAEISVRSSARHVERHEGFASLHEDSAIVATAPIRQAASAVAAQPLRTNGSFLDPNRLAGARVKGLDETNAVWRIEHAVDHERRHAEVVRNLQLRVGFPELRIHGRPAPSDP